MAKPPCSLVLPRSLHSLLRSFLPMCAASLPRSYGAPLQVNKLQAKVCQRPELEIMLPGQNIIC